MNNMNNVLKDLYPAIFLKLPDLIPVTLVCKKWHEEIEKICLAFCKTQKLDLTTPVKTFCNYRTLTANPSFLSSTTYSETLLKTFGLGLSEFYDLSLDETLDPIKLNKFLIENKCEKSDIPPHIYHNHHVAFPIDKGIRILDLVNHRVETIDISAQAPNLIYYFDDNEILFRSSGIKLVSFNRATKECTEFVVNYNCISVVQTKNLLLFSAQDANEVQLFSINKNTHAEKYLDCSWALVTASNKEDLFATLTVDGCIKIYQDDGVVLNLSNSLYISDYEVPQNGVRCLKFYRDLLFFQQEGRFLIINPVTGTILSDLNNIAGNAPFSFLTNQLITRNIDAYNITYTKYSFNG